MPTMAAAGAITEALASDQDLQWAEEAHGNSTNQKATADPGEVTRGPRATTGISQLYLPPLRILQSYKSDGASKLRHEMISSKQLSPPLQKRR